MMNINDFTNSVNDPRLKDAIRRLGNTPEGQRFLKSITPRDRENLLKQLQGVNASGITAEMLLRQLNNNPDILNKLSGIINQKR